MALLSVSALGSCQTGGSTNVTELTKEQKDNLKYLYKWYQFFTETKPGIPDDQCPAGGGRVLCGFRQAGA